MTTGGGGGTGNEGGENGGPGIGGEGTLPFTGDDLGLLALIGGASVVAGRALYSLRNAFLRDDDEEEDLVG